MITTPTRPRLTPPAKMALQTAEYHLDTKRRYLLPSFYQSAAELVEAKLVKDLGASLVERRYVVTELGRGMREWVLRTNALARLAREVRDHSITGEDLTDVAAAVDNDQEECVGVSIEFYLAFKCRAELDGESGETLRLELERFLGWS